MSSQELRAVVRGTYDLQRLRIQMGNRVTANFKAKLGNSPKALTEKQLEKEAQKLLGDLRASHKRITDAIIEKYKGVTPKNFIGDELISTYTEYVLVNQYTELIKQEESQFSSIPTILAGNPVYDNFLEGVAGVGPQMAGVLLSEIDFTRCKYASSLWKLSGVDVVTIGHYVNDKGEEKILPARVIESHYETNGHDVIILAEGKYPVTLEQVGRSRKEFCLELSEYTAKDGSTKVKQGISFNPFLKTKLIGVLASSFLRAGKTLVDGVSMSSAKRLELAKSLGYKPKTKSEEEDEIPSSSPVDDFLRANGHDVIFHPSYYGKMYYDNRARLVASPHHKEKTALHIHNMALRFMIKRFLVDLYVHGRKSVGMPVHEEYGVAKLGMIPHGQDV